MPVYIESFDKLYKKLGIEDNGPAQAFMTETCYKAMDKYVPRRTGSDGGTLRDTVTLETSRIIYQTEYAAYQYFGQRQDGSHKVKNYSTPGTGPYWDQRMISSDIKDVVKQVQDYIRR